MLIKLLKSQFIIYGLVGVFVTLLKLFSLYLFRNILGIPTYLSVIISYILAVITHFFINKHLTFKISEKGIANKITLRYFFALIIAFAFYSFNIWFLHNIFSISFYIAVYLALFLSFIFNYFLYKNYVFNKKTVK